MRVIVCLLLCVSLLTACNGGVPSAHKELLAAHDWTLAKAQSASEYVLTLEPAERDTFTAQQLSFIVDAEQTVVKQYTYTLKAWTLDGQALICHVYEDAQSAVIGAYIDVDGVPYPLDAKEQLVQQQVITLTK